MDEHLGCVHLWVMASNAAVDLLLLVLLSVCLEVELPGHTTILSKFLKDHTVFHSHYTI
jgi:hypothetical protein